MKTRNSTFIIGEVRNQRKLLCPTNLYLCVIVRNVKSCWTKKLRV